MKDRNSKKCAVSFGLQVAKLPVKGTTVTLEATPSQRAELAKIHNLLSVERFFAELLVRPWKGDGVRVTGRVEADVTQSCIVTLEPLVAHIDEPVSAIFVPEGSRLARQEQEDGEIILEPEGEDPPEPFVGNSIDMGALAEEFFSLGIDPYPRKEGAPMDLSTEESGKSEAGPLYEKLRKLSGNG